MAKRSRIRAAEEGPRRLVCIVEGKGEVGALPKLCLRVRDMFEAWHWQVDANPVRQPRSQLTSRTRLERAIWLAKSRPADAVLIVCDADDDCPVHWAADANAALKDTNVVGSAVMIQREFETWFLLSHYQAPRLRGRDIETIRDAKGELSRLVENYKPTIHQAKLVSSLDISYLRSASSSFSKFVRSLSLIFSR